RIPGGRAQRPARPARRRRRAGRRPRPAGGRPGAPPPAGGRRGAAARPVHVGGQRRRPAGDLRAGRGVRRRRSAVGSALHERRAVRGLQDRIVVVTGAGRGMGQAIAGRLAAEGARVAVTDVDEEAAKAAAGDLAARIGDITAALGPIDALVNNAGWDRMAPFLQTDEDLWDRLIDINLRGPIRMTKAVLPQMVERGAGRIVNSSSDAGRVGSTGEAVYSACKAGIIGFGKTVAREVARHNVTVNALCPGP